MSVSNPVSSDVHGFLYTTNLRTQALHSPGSCSNTDMINTGDRIYREETAALITAVLVGGLEQINASSPGQLRQQIRCIISLPSPPNHALDPWASRIGGPEINQQTVEVLPFLINCFIDGLPGGVKRVDVDTSNALGFDGLNYGGNPLDTRGSPQKAQTFEFRGP